VERVRTARADPALIAESFIAQPVGTSGMGAVAEPVVSVDNRDLSRYTLSAPTF